ncbi:MAG: ferredoxin-NADP reductase [Candidatus Azotimanducaceae bacterium]|jgi:ferredoxin-NADP reductase/predicted pyridoxine 5'-phosphate oxidase superfamily flavin-nucleotide-binding protein
MLDSPFHKGEQEAQNRLGVRDKMERFGRQVIRDHMPQQHIEFYQSLPFIFAGHSDKDGWPWASILTGSPGFIKGGDSKSLELHARPFPGDPLADSLQEGTAIGILGIELETRRRNRLATHVAKVTEDKICLEVDQSFGNCPQYIQHRKLSSALSNTPPANLPQGLSGDFFELDNQALALISNSDTFFVASAFSKNSTDKGGHKGEGADVSHRGGKPGFIRIDSNLSLTIPDYTGNFHFNTFGNFIKNPRAGLLFIDFEKGHLLSLTGIVEIQWESPETKHFAGAERLWTFTLDHGRWLKSALPYRWDLEQYSPNTLMTGTWDEAKLLAKAEHKRNQWLPYKVTRIEEESENVKSFYLSATGHQKATFEAGQYLTVKATISGARQIRTYTLSSSPNEESYRISVKEDKQKKDNIPKGVFSEYLHNDVNVGDYIEAKAPSGAFFLETDSKRPVVLIAGGIGITPMVSMARHLLMEGIRTRSNRQVTIITSDKTINERAFSEELSKLSYRSGGRIKYFSALTDIKKTNPINELELGKDYSHKGRISREFIESAVPIDKENKSAIDFYLCGPGPFMQSIYDVLRAMEIDNQQIFAEEFGPASLARDNDEAKKASLPTATEALIQFENSNVEQLWSKGDGTLLEFAENHGFSPEFSCRRGQCGACVTKLISGKVSYTDDIEAHVNEDEILLCCAAPAKETSGEISIIKLAL